MPFTFQALNEDNTVGIAQISITIDPTAAILPNWLVRRRLSHRKNQYINDDLMWTSTTSSPPTGTPLWAEPQDARLLAERLRWK